MNKEIKIDKFYSGTIYEHVGYYYLKNGNKIYHREDGPAIEYGDGDKAWYINGKYHRLDGPSSEYKNGYKEIGRAHV